MNLTNLAVSALVANSVSQNVAGVGAWDFFTAGTSLNNRSESGYIAGGGTHWNKVITLKEIMSGGQLGKGSSGVSISEAFMDNIKGNWLPLTVAVVGIPIAANVATKLLRRSIILPANRMLKSVGITEVKL